jgi:hypothetical protein
VRVEVSAELGPSYSRIARLFFGARLFRHRLPAQIERFARVIFEKDARATFGHGFAVPGRTQPDRAEGVIRGREDLAKELPFSVGLPFLREIGPFHPARRFRRGIPVIIALPSVLFFHDDFKVFEDKLLNFDGQVDDGCRRARALLPKFDGALGTPEIEKLKRSFGASKAELPTVQEALGANHEAKDVDGTVSDDHGLDLELHEERQSTKRGQR